jgi:DNA-binding CsgD family transcriptional regulator
MTESSFAASSNPMTVKERLDLTEPEQRRLILAIESAIDVQSHDEFTTWIRGPFRTLLPHDSVVCIGLAPGGKADVVASTHHGLVNASNIGMLADPVDGLAVRLARAYCGNRRQSCLVDGAALSEMLAGVDAVSECGQPRNAVIHRVKLVSGHNYFFILFDVGDGPLERTRQILRLLSSHLKMAIARAIIESEPRNSSALTRREIEIVYWMGQQKSNRQISSLLGISAITLKAHVTRLYRKLDVQNRDAAVAKAGIDGGIDTVPLQPINLERKASS